VSDPEVRARIEELTAEILPQARAEAYKVWQRAPHVLELDELHSLALSGLAAAAARWETYCVVPSVRVLTADLRWVPAGSLAVGDELIGVDEENPSRASRCYRRSVVLAAPRHELPCVRLTLEDGRQVTTSEDHRWLVYRRTGNYRARRLDIHQDSYRWMEAGLIKPGTEIAAPLRVWPEETSFEAGWLSGIFDGEGWLVKHGASNTMIGFSQNDGPVWDRALKVLADMDIPYRVSRRDNDGCNRLTIGARWASMETIGRLRPYRLLPRADQLWEGWRIVRVGSPNRLAVVKAEFVGCQEVVALETSTATYLAEGLVSHNCAEKGHDPTRYEYFPAYCLRRMRGAMLDWLRSQDWVTRSARTRAKAIRDAGQDQGLTEAELARATGLTPAEVRETIAAVSSRPVSLDAEPYDVAAADDVEGSAVVGQVLAAVARVLAALSPAARVIVALRFYHGVPAAAAAAVAGVEAEEGALLYAEAILRIHDAMLRAVDG